MAENDATDDPRTEEMKREMAQHFDEFEADYRDEATAGGVVYEDDEVIIAEDTSGHELNEWGSEFDGVTSTELSEWFHKVARKKCDRRWPVSDPVVFDKLE